MIKEASADGTWQVLKECLNAQQAVCFSAPDRGIYDALSKGLARATGDLIGLMHSDDFYSDNEVFANLAAAFGGDQGDQWQWDAL